MRFLIILVAVAACYAEGVTIDLPVYHKAPGDQAAAGAQTLSQGQLDSATSEDQGGLLTRLHVVSSLGQRIAAASAPVKEGATPEGRGLFAPATQLEAAVFDPEDPLSQKTSIRDNLHHAVAGVFRPRPLVDTLREEEKYGNAGDRFYTAGRAIVKGAAGVSQAVNSVLEVPGRIFRKFSRTATESLNNLGGRLIGL